MTCAASTWRSDADSTETVYVHTMHLREKPRLIGNGKRQRTVLSITKRNGTSFLKMYE